MARAIVGRMKRLLALTRPLSWLLACAACAGNRGPTAAEAGSLDATAADRAAIRELVDRLCDAINHHDWVGVGALLTEDAVWETLPPIGWRAEGRSAIVAFLSGNGDRVELLSYQLSSTAIDVQSPTRASARSFMNELLRLKQSETGLRLAGTYLDRFQKGPDGRWRFAHRTFQVRYEDDVALPSRLQGAGGSRTPDAVERSRPLTPGPSSAAPE